MRSDAAWSAPLIAYARSAWLDFVPMHDPVSGTR